MTAKNTAMVIALSVLVSMLPVVEQRAAADEPPKVYVRNLWPDWGGNKGLAFCSGTGTTGCIEGLVFDGVEAVETSVLADADYEIAGGVYPITCRFVTSIAAPCEAPYFHIYPSDEDQELGRVVIEFRRLMTSSSTSSIGLVLASGEVQSFAPAMPGSNDVARIEIDTIDIAIPYGSMNNVNPSCFGYYTGFDSSPMPEVANGTTTNRIAVLLVPSHRSPAVPSESGVLVFDESAVGSWVDTSAAFYGPSEVATSTGSVVFRLGGPHYVEDTDPDTATDANLNHGVYRNFVTSGFLWSAFGLRAAEANSESLPVTKIWQGSTTPTETTYEVVPGGLLVTTVGITFSTPSISTTRVLNIPRGTSLSKSRLIAVAGLSSVQRFYSSPVAPPSGSGARVRGSSITFNKSGTFTINIKYKTAKRSSILTRTLVITVD